MLLLVKPVSSSTTTTQPLIVGSGTPGQGTSTPASIGSLTVRLEELKRARDAGLITEEEFQKKKQDMVSAL
jgi:hypothetical protein